MFGSGEPCHKCGKHVVYEDAHWETINAENDVLYCGTCWKDLL